MISVNKKSKIVILFIAIILIISIFLLIFKTKSSEQQTAIKVGCIMSGKIEDSGWNSVHYNGIKSACDILDAELLVKEDV